MSFSVQQLEEIEITKTGFPTSIHSPFEKRRMIWCLGQRVRHAQESRINITERWRSEAEIAGGPRVSSRRVATIRDRLRVRLLRQGLLAFAWNKTKQL